MQQVQPPIPSPANVPFQVNIETGNVKMQLVPPATGMYGPQHILTGCNWHPATSLGKPGKLESRPSRAALGEKCGKTAETNASGAM